MCRLRESSYNVYVEVDYKQYVYNVKNGCYKEKRHLEPSDPLFYVDKCEDELNDLVNQNNFLRKNSNFMAITIQLTNACNFACPYCFESHDDENALSIFDVEIIRKIVIDYLEENRIVKNIVVFWFGGEPLLNYEIMVSASEMFVDLEESHGITYTSRLITNGYFLETIQENIRDLHITDIQVTLDGAKDIHDRRRFSKNGCGTFEKIINNLVLLSTPVDLIVRMNIDKDNIHNALSLSKIIRDLPFYPSVNVFFQPALVENHGGASSCCLCTPNSDNELMSYFLSIQSDIGILDKITYIKSFCNVDFPGSLVISSDRCLHKCWAQVVDCEKAFGTLDSSLDIIRKGMAFRSFEIKSGTCLKCPIFPVCMCGCKNKPFDLSLCLWKKKKTMETIKMEIKNQIRKI